MKWDNSTIKKISISHCLEFKDQGEKRAKNKLYRDQCSLPSFTPPNAEKCLTAGRTARSFGTKVKTIKLHTALQVLDVTHNGTHTFLFKLFTTSSNTK